MEEMHGAKYREMSQNFHILSRKIEGDLEG